MVSDNVSKQFFFRVRTENMTDSPMVCERVTVNGCKHSEHFINEVQGVQLFMHLVILPQFALLCCIVCKSLE